MKLLPLLGGAALPAFLLFACATDNGDALHGPQFGPVPGRPDGSVADGPLPGEDPDGGAPDSEAGADDAADAATSPCTTGTVAVIAGTNTTLTGAAQIKGGAWSGAAITGGAAMSAPALVPFGAGFVGLTQGPSNAMQAVTYGTSWGTAAAVGALATYGTPALTVLGTKAQAVFLSASATDTNKFVRIENTGASWTTTGDPVMPPPPSSQSFGNAPGTIAAAGTELVFAQDGSDEGLYVQKWNGTWSAAEPIVGAGTFATGSPTLVAVDGTFDLVLLYPDKLGEHVIGYATRNATSKAWSTAQVTQATALTSAPMAVARISPLVLLVTFRGTNMRPYFMTGTIGASAITWSVPVPLLADATTVDSPPAVAKGVCGDDAIAVFASGGQVKATRYRGTTWSTPETVIGASGTRVSVATR